MGGVNSRRRGCKNDVSHFAGFYVCFIKRLSSKAWEEVQILFVWLPFLVQFVAR